MSLGQNDNAILKLLADEQLRKENAALAAENERLKELVESNLNIGKKVLGQSDALRIERDSLAAENERLRKAGDQMDAYLKRQDGTTNGMLDCRRAWLEAKEGGAK